jgi:hypothetical protein
MHSEMSLMRDMNMIIRLGIDAPFLTIHFRVFIEFFQLSRWIEVSKTGITLRSAGSTILTLYQTYDK